MSREVVMLCVAVSCSVLPFVAVCCTDNDKYMCAGRDICVAACCSVLQ